MKHAEFTQHDADAQLLAISKRFDQHAVELARHYMDSGRTPWEEQVDEICLDAVGAALLEAAIGIRHQGPAGRAAKEQMLAHIERWAGGDSVPYNMDDSSLGGRLARSLEQ